MPRNPLRAAARRETGRPVKSFRPGEILSTGSAGKAILSDWSTERGIREGYASSQWVYAAVRRISQAAASVPWVASLSTPEGEEDRPEHPLTRLMSRPNSHISGHDMIERVVCHLYLGGNAILSKIRYRGVIDEIWPIMPDRVKPIPDTRTFISGYEVTSASGRRMIEKPRDICHLMFMDPGSDYWGMAPLRAAAMSVDTDVEAVRWNRIALQNRAVTDGVLSTDHSLTDEQYERLAEQMQGHRGPDNARRAFILEGGLGWQQMSLSPAEMDFVNSRRMTREDILSCFAPGTLVYSEHGVKPIQDISEGERVLTHRGRYRRVRRTMMRPYMGDMVRLRGKGLDSVLVTPNHPFVATGSHRTYSKAARALVHRKTPAQWVDAGELRARGKRKARGYNKRPYDNVVIPALSCVGERDVLDLSETARDGVFEVDGKLRFSNPRSVSVPRHVGLDERFGRLVGLYLAEGSTNDHQTVWYFHEDEHHLHSEVQDTLSDLFGVSSAVRHRSRGRVRSVIASNRILRDFFNHFGKRASGKHIPAWAMEAPQEFIDGLLAGYVDGDGHERENGTRTLTTVSTSLAWQVRLLLWSRKVHSSISRCSASELIINGIETRSEGSFSLQWAEERDQSRTSVSFAEEDTGGAYAEFFLKDATVEDYEGFVYNLSVEEDESYVTVGGACHNCFGVPPAMVGIVQSATQSDVLAMRRSFWLDTVVPLLRDMESGLNLSLSPEFGENVRLRPMLETVDALQEDRGTLIAQAVQLFSMGVDMREINRMLELGLSEEGLSDVGYLAQNLVPVPEAGVAQSSIAEQATRARTNQSIVRAMLGLEESSTNGNGG